MQMFDVKVEKQYIDIRGEQLKTPKKLLILKGVKENLENSEGLIVEDLVMHGYMTNKDSLEQIQFTSFFL